MAGREVSSVTSLRIQRAIRLNKLEDGRLHCTVSLLDKEQTRRARIYNKDVRMINSNLDVIQTSTGQSPEGLTPDHVTGALDEGSGSTQCFLYGERIGSRRFGKFRHRQGVTSASAYRSRPASRTEKCQEAASDISDVIADGVVDCSPSSEPTAPPSSRPPWSPSVISVKQSPLPTETAMPLFQRIKTTNSITRRQSGQEHCHPCIRETSDFSGSARFRVLIHNAAGFSTAGVSDVSGQATTRRRSKSVGSDSYTGTSSEGRERFHRLPSRPFLARPTI